MQRRQFITLLGGAAAWPLAARAQPSERLRLVGVLVPGASGDTHYQTWVQVFRQALAAVGWTNSNIRIDARFATDSATEIRKQAAELVARAPDVILAHGASTIRPLQQATRSIPIVFPILADPVGAGIVRSQTRPGGNVTGFMTAEYGTAGKWLELLKEIAPGIPGRARICPATSATVCAKQPALCLLFDSRFAVRKPKLSSSVAIDRRTPCP